MNLSTCATFSHLLNKVVDDFAKTIPKVDAVHSVLEVACKKLSVRVMAAAFIVIGAVFNVIGAVQDLLPLNTKVVSSRGIFSFAMFNVNVIFFKIVGVGMLSLVGAIISPHYVYSQFDVLERMLQDFCRLLLELPENLETLVRKMGLEFPPLPLADPQFENWREMVARRLVASLPEYAEPALRVDDSPSFINFHPHLYRTALVDFFVDLETPESDADAKKLIKNWTDSKIEKNKDYRKLLKFYAKEHEKVSSNNDPQAKRLALVRFEKAFEVSGKRDARKKMRTLYLIVHPDKAVNFTEKRKKQLEALFKFANEFAKFALS